ncbi:TasA family protein [Natroniella sulfidigena]|uniref:TasA family protein n=1 Tax=Natroniella sulfidigena TaxID=723921 RepID=UPI0031F4D234
MKGGMKMSFTAQSSSDDSSTTNASVDINVSPDTIITETNLTPGDDVTGRVNADNTGSIDHYYFVSADWAPENFNASRTAVLANTLTASVISDPDGTPETLFTGILSDLIDRPDSPGRELLEGTDEDVEFTVGLPDDAGNLVQALDISVDFVFVAVD